jgi:hypothetical protein
VPTPPPSTGATVPTTEFSSATTDGNAVGSSALTSSISAYARAPSSRTDSEPES